MIQAQEHEAGNSHKLAALSYPVWTYLLHYPLGFLLGSGVKFLYFQGDKLRFAEKCIHFSE